MIVLVDNYDSFSYNLYQMLGTLHADIEVVRNDAVTVQDIVQKKPSHIVLSPGPGRPEQAGISIDLVQAVGCNIPILGVCLGHQAICATFGGEITYAKTLMHGKASTMQVMGDCPLFDGLPREFAVARYHSLVARRETLPQALEVVAQTQDGQVMAVQHRQFPIYGVQFHPESILTEHGQTILQHFLRSASHD